MFLRNANIFEKNLRSLIRPNCCQFIELSMMHIGHGVHKKEVRIFNSIRKYTKIERLPWLKSSMHIFFFLLFLLLGWCVMPRDKAPSSTAQSCPFISQGCLPHEYFTPPSFIWIKMFSHNKGGRKPTFSYPVSWLHRKPVYAVHATFSKWILHGQVDLKTHIYYLQCLRLYYFQMHQICGKKLQSSLSGVRTFVTFLSLLGGFFSRRKVWKCIWKYVPFQSV